MDDKENQKAPKWRGLSQNQTKLFLKGVKKWGIQKKDNIVSENKFPTDFKINEGTCLNQTPIMSHTCNLLVTKNK